MADRAPQSSASAGGAAGASSAGPSAGSSAGSSGQWWNYGALKDGLKKYGRTGVVVYLAISFSVTTGEGSRGSAWEPRNMHAEGRSPACRLMVHAGDSCPGWYIAIERNVDVKKLLGMKGAQLSFPGQRGMNGVLALAC
jgi:hypothetical protein